MTTAVSDGERRCHRRLLVVRCGLAVAAIMAIVRTFGLGHDDILAAADLFVRLDPTLVGVVLVLEAVWAVALAATQRHAVRALSGDLSLRDALRISMAGFTLSRVVPGGGAAGGLFAMRELVRLRHRPAGAATALVASWAISIISLGVLVFGGLGGVALNGDVIGVPVATVAATLAVLASVGCAVLGALYHPPLRRRLTQLVTGVARHLPVSLDADEVARLFEGAADRRRRHLGRGFRWAIVAWAVDATALWVVFAACGHRLSLTALVVGYGSANLLNSVPELTPGWLGVFEAAQSATFITLGVPAGVALAAVLVYRMASFWLPTAAGIVPAVRSLARSRDAATADVPDGPRRHQRVSVEAGA
ncbi:MAG TPA: lysylphosphatidylglycerol synthase transmembrane domain-containing protein [Euzebyales bacterium]|nr:lysylphosphatidylglycerol synthase transmembrane domain-containing protein [Euzebyales bacterium]